MIPKRYIEEWKEFAPWSNDAQIEQDLIIERAVVEIFNDDFLKENLAFRGGTALHKIHLKPQVRYSEDIDLVQVKEGTIKPILEKIRKQLSFLGTKRNIKQNENNNTISYRFESEIPPVIRLRLKIEINCREHFNVLGLKEINHNVNNTWFTNSCEILSYELEELLATKLRALYQRRKGRDLFDLYWALSKKDVNIDKIIHYYKQYMKFAVDNPPSRKQFLKNMEIKVLDPEFTGDIFALLRPGIEYDNLAAFELIRKELIDKI